MATRKTTADPPANGDGTLDGTLDSAPGIEVLQLPDQAIELRPLDIINLEVTVKGITPLVTHRFDEKSRRQMADAQQQKQAANAKRPPKDPDAEFNSARYIIDAKRDGLPAAAFKSAIVQGARFFNNKKLSMALLKQSVFVHGEGPDQLVAIISGKPTMREDPVRLPSGSPDLRYRPMYNPWTVTFTVSFVAAALTKEAVLALINAGGLVGVGEWRPGAPKSVSGNFGRFEVR